MRLIYTLLLLALVSCHPFAAYWPSALKNEEKIAVRDLSKTPHGAVEIVVDNWGVPHLFGENEEELSYALGFMHGRDRRFQVFTAKYAASGRLTEIFGKRALDFDRVLRMLTFRIEEQFESLDERDQRIMKSYANGVNEGMRIAGRSVEESLLGAQLEPFRAIDSLLIGRLQAWELAQDFMDELARWRIAKAGITEKSLRSIFLAPVWAANVPITGSSPKAASGVFDEDFFPSVLEPLGENLPTPVSKGRDGSLWPDIPQLFGIGSNSYVVSGKFTASGKPILCNDPHLEHRAPSVFYLAHLEHPKFGVLGATVPGVPAVLIGRGRHVAFGMTASYADAQDLVRLQIDPDDSESYIVDDKKLKMNRLEQKFIYGKGSSDVLVETWHSTIFGLVLPPVLSKFKDAKDEFALQWGGFYVGKENRAPVSGFWDLMKSTNIDEATLAIDKFSFAGLNVALAFVDGTIAYRLAALVPIRQTNERNYLPKDGRFSNAAWSGFVPMVQRPSVTNPNEGFIVAANQRIVPSNHALANAIGRNSASWSRALRIHQRLENFVSNADKKKISDTDLLSIQQDTIAPEAQAIAPMLASLCPENIEPFSRKIAGDFCDAIKKFNGDFAEQSQGALPYVRLMSAINSVILNDNFSEAVATQVQGRPFSHVMISQALLMTPHSPFHQNSKLKEIIEKAAPIALRQIISEAGTSPESWEWGKSHTLMAKGILFPAPILGSLFSTKKHPQGGYGHAPRAESGLPVRAGAVLRLAADMLEKPKAKMVLDAGNGGTPGHRHYQDMQERWNTGDLIEFPVERNEVLSGAEEHFWLTNL